MVAFWWFCQGNSIDARKETTQDCAMTDEILKNKICPICNSPEGSAAEKIPNNFDGEEWNCAVCGHFRVARSLLRTQSFIDMNKMVRASLSNRLISFTQVEEVAALNTMYFEEFLKEAKLPSMAQQASNFIRLVGDCFSKTGEALRFDRTHYSRIGSLDSFQAVTLMKELVSSGIFSGDTQGINLTLHGSQLYEEGVKGKFASNYGFIARQFNNRELDELFNDFVKPIVKTIGFELVDLRDVPEAGLIDNLLRMKIRDAAFVIADLTHGNKGAYWEAGFAEGLGKPVIYFCEKSVFESADSDTRPHFDTNHMQTIPFVYGDPDSLRNLIPTIQNSLKLLPTKGK